MEGRITDGMVVGTAGSTIVNMVVNMVGMPVCRRQSGTIISLHATVASLKLATPLVATHSSVASLARYPPGTG